MLGQYNLAPTLYSVEKCSVELLIPKLTWAVKPGKKRVHCMFQEHIHTTGFYDHRKDKFAEPFRSFRRKVRNMASKYGLQAVDLKKGNILISAAGLRCIDFDDWRIVDPILFGKIGDMKIMPVKT